MIGVSHVFDILENDTALENLKKVKSFLFDQFAGQFVKT